MMEHHGRPAARPVPGPPPAQGLYDPAREHDACGVGFVVHIKGQKSHDIVRKALQVLINLLHRGACGCEPNTGDGAGILLQMPDRFLRRECARLGIPLPAPTEYGAGLVFLPRAPAQRERVQALVAGIVAEEGQRLLGWRDVPSDDRLLGATALSVEPWIRQVFIGRGPGVRDHAHFERTLYVVRKRIESAVAELDIPERAFVYLPSLSSNTLIYKGMLSADQIETMYPDLTDPDVESALALVHQRFSTNTFPSWPLAHPYRYIAHNGEINTLRGNINWMRARQALCASDVLGEDLAKVFPVTREGLSDSATFDNVLEFLVMSGRSLPHAILMMIPEPWQRHESMSPERRAFYEYHASLMEPWDGPASIAFTDGTVIGAVLDRNGLRPSRYYVTKDDLVIMASEVGVLDIPPENVLVKERLHPGRIFLVDTAQGRIIADEEIKAALAAEHPYGEWLRQHQVRLEDLAPAPVGESDHATVLVRQLAFGYTHEDLRILMTPMARQGEEPIGSMGTDTALAVLSERPRLLYDYFKQLFAQVTNPPLDQIREELVTAMESTVGPEGNLLRPEPGSCRQIVLKDPVLSNDDLAKLAHVSELGFKATTLPMLFPAAGGAPALEGALGELQRHASRAIADGANVLILSDRGVDRELAPIPSLLATAAVHHHLVRQGERIRCGLVVETGDAREVHHMCLLIGYGAGAVNPWVAFETLDDMIRQGLLPGLDHAKAVRNYIKALNKGILKVMAKMGISTLQSYCGAQIFEAIGLNRDVVDRYFTGTASRVSGIGADVIAEEARRRHARAFPERPVGEPELDWGGEYQWRRDGEHHMVNPDMIARLQHATRSGSYTLFTEYTRLCDDQSAAHATLRGLVGLHAAAQPIPLEEVEPVEAVLKRFATGAMSYGSISQEAHETLAIAMNRIGARSNTGEGGEDAARYRRDPNGDWRRSAVKQVASGRFGVTSEYLVNADDLQIKMAQGAKPGEGGQLPGRKVYPWIARVRLSMPGVGLISPPPHHDIYSIEDLAQLIHDLKNANPKARIHVKLVAEVGVGTVAAGVAKAHADVVLISGHDGGTGASPLTSIKHGGIPWELGLAETQQVLVLNKLRDRIVVQVDGQMKTGRDVVVAALLGAEEYGFSTAPLVVLGCIMMRVCHLNTCPVGIATQDPELRKRFAGRPEHVVAFFRFLAQEVREHMARLGFRTMEEMIGRVDRLDFAPALDHWKARGLDLSAVLHPPDMPPEVARRRVVPQDHGLEKGLDHTTLIPACREAIEHRRPVSLTLPIRNVNRTVGTTLGYEVTSRWGAEGLPDDTIKVRFSGSAGQSFGAFLPRGITFTLEGDANDYWGKGLSGGRLIVYPPRRATFVPEENIVIGNVALYGATSGEAYVRGVAGERFGVRNSGVHAVVEGVGDHGCEYMTGGRVVVIGRTGRNFAAGMSGGIAYVLDLDGDFARRCNREMVDLEPLEQPADVQLVGGLIDRHVTYTGSAHAAKILANWRAMQARFAKVMPRDYKRVLAAEARARAEGREPSFQELVGAAGG
ncbi:MAG: glutamate synthase subunit alpha [Candidatus Rokubacteria bacterium RIFCSPLOWO2_02_FULL_73_56]|nr:MAG: glutamate synthase subunit alpha [Candidatus Rokubacteria bacterium RIFCSPHIGHO2_02_FULL_73_26]OGL09378.1 MAG: glutamate synthase subunit alpha [Candidatus Rokubacteria bacterium RIFCSPLOWO2_02_FULL_73_56]OGL29209.1 MAG: glutamate synthase subunit alpha [Candidatus Rokubacteria bacterium RIFCSPLOWO2_12_FULL_73_47]